jgi:hypothetical protein
MLLFFGSPPTGTITRASPSERATEDLRPLGTKGTHIFMIVPCIIVVAKAHKVVEAIGLGRGPSAMYFHSEFTCINEMPE